MKSRLCTMGWLALLSGVILFFFHETILEGFSLVPTDVLHRLTAPYNRGVQDFRVQNHYPWDIVRIDYPFAQFAQERMRAGEVPLWNPYIYGGHPHMAVSMHGVFNPFKVLYLFLSTERAFSLGIVLELWLAGLLMFAFLRELDRSRPAAFLGGVAYALNSGFLMWYWRVPSTMAWAPLILLLVERSVRREPWWGYAVGAGGILGLAMISGSIQAASHLGFLCVVYMVGTVVSRDNESRAKSLQRVGVVLLVGMLLYAVQLLPTIELVLNGGMRRIQETGPKMNLRRTVLDIPFLVTFMFPGLAGSTESYALGKAFGVDIIEFTSYIGIVPFVLFVVGAVTGRERPARWLLLTAGAVVVILVFTPLARFLYYRFFIVVTFAMSVVAAYGMDALLDASAAHSRTIRRSLFGLVIAGLAVTIGLLAVQWIVAANWKRVLEAGQEYVLSHEGMATFSIRQWELDRVELFLRHYRITNVVFWLPLTFLAGTVVGWQAYVRGWLSRNAFIAGLLLFTVTDLTVLGRKTVPQVDLRQFPLYPRLETIQTVQADRDLFRVEQWEPDKTLFFYVNLLFAYDLSTIRNEDSMVPETGYSLPYRLDGQWTALADLLNIKYVLVPDSVTLPEDRFSLVQQSQGIRLYRNDRCLPRLQFIPGWKAARSHEEVLAAMSASTFDPRQMVFIETGSAPPLRGPPAESGLSTVAATVQVEQYEPRRVRAHVRCSQPGVVLLADTFYPGWYATVDGAPAPIYRADYVMRAVFVTAGDHEIEFRYDPLSFRLGATISISTLVVVALSLVSSGRRGRTYANTSPSG